MSEDFCNAIQIVKEYAGDLNTDYIEESEQNYPDTKSEKEENEDHESGVSLSVVPEKGEGPIYHVVGFPQDRFFKIECHYSLVGAIASELTEKTATEILAEYPIDYEEEYLTQFLREPDDEDLQCVAAAIGWLESLDSDQVDQIVYSLSETFASAPIKFRIHTTPSGEGIIGFQTHEKIFPYESDFSIRQFNKSVERVRLPTYLGRLYLKMTFNLGINDARENTNREIGPQTAGDDS